MHNEKDFAFYKLQFEEHNVGKNSRIAVERGGTH